MSSRNKTKPFTIMEVCGTHTHAIAKAGLKQLLPENVKLISGPGCPVCVTSNAAIDEMIALADMPNVIIATFGDMVRVPGSTTSLQTKPNVHVVYSAMDAVELAKQNPNKEIVFLGVGFETTAPTTAVAIKNAPRNFSVYCAHKNMPHALQLLMKDPELEVDGLLLPGHVSTIIGIEPYKSLGIPGVVAGFEPEDIMQAIAMLLECDNDNGNAIKIAYTRGVKPEGNPVAVGLINEVFEECDSEWRGIGNIPKSGYKIKPEYKSFDAKEKFDIKIEPPKENPACKCGSVLRGILPPEKCPLFSKVCTPMNPVGPCMVSSEGTCSAAYNHNI